MLSLYTEIWALYLGVLFVLTVMLFPAGLTGLIAMHARPLQLGKLGLLAWPYLKMLLPALLFVLSSAAALEILFHSRHAALGDEKMSLLDITFNAHGVLPIGSALLLAAASLFVVMRLAPELRGALGRSQS